MSDLATLATAAQKAQDALATEREKQAAVAATRAAEARERAIAAAFHTIAKYEDRIAEASVRVQAATAAFDAGCRSDLAAAVAAYLTIIAESAIGNRLTADRTAARHTLQEAGVLPRIDRGMSRDALPFPLTGPGELPSFLDLLSSSLNQARRAASNAPATVVDEDDVKVTDALRDHVLRSEWILDQDHEAMLGLRERWPDRFARLPDDQKADVAAYAATREARGYDAPLPKIAGADRVDVAAPRFAPDDTARFTLYDQEHVPPRRPSGTGI